MAPRCCRSRLREEYGTLAGAVLRCDAGMDTVDPVHGEARYFMTSRPPSVPRAEAGSLAGIEGAAVSLAPVAEHDPLIKRADLQRRLGVSSDTMRRWIRDGKLPPPDFYLTRENLGWRASTLRAAGANVA